MNKLKELLEKTEYTKDEWETYKKVQKNCQLQDMECLLDEMLEFGSISKEDYSTAKEKAELIISKYDKWFEYDWEETMRNAINWIIKGE